MELIAQDKKIKRGRLTFILVRGIGGAFVETGVDTAEVRRASEAGIPAGFGRAVISGLADDVHVSSTSAGVSVRMSWPSAAVAG